jgi:hypothetical protein
MTESSEASPESREAWQPFTFGGVASFAEAGLLRLLGVEFVVALLIAGIVVGFVRHAYSPVILEAIQKMPHTARIEQGRLAGVDATLVSDSRFLAIAVTPDVFDQVGQSADVQVQLRRDDFRVGAVFRPEWGWEFDYGTKTDLNLSQSYLEPWWGAWHPIVYAVAGIATMAGLFVLWALCAVIYTLPAYLIGWMADRRLSLTGGWRLSAATLMPGGILVAVGIFLYGWASMDLVGLAFVYLAHLLSSLVYLVGGVLACPRILPEAPKPNPFIS